VIYSTGVRLLSTDEGRINGWGSAVREERGWRGEARRRDALILLGAYGLGLAVEEVDELLMAADYKPLVLRLRHGLRTVVQLGQRHRGLPRLANATVDSILHHQCFRRIVRRPSAEDLQDEGHRLRVLATGAASAEAA
jgi:hypothetical protein